MWRIEPKIDTMGILVAVALPAGRQVSWRDISVLVAVAQLVERQLVELNVAGSSPVGHPSQII